MLYTNSSLLTFIFMLLLFSTPSTLALTDNSNDIPTREDIQSQLDTLNKQKELSTQEKLVQQDLTQTLEALNKIEHVKAETAQLHQRVAEAPNKLRQAIASLSALSDIANDTKIRKTLETLSLRQLELRIAQLLNDLQNAQSDLAACNSQLILLQTQPERVQNSMYNASQQLQQIRNNLSGTIMSNSIMRPSQQTLLLVQQILLNTQIEQQRKSLEGNAILQDTLQKQRDYTITNINYLEHQLQILQEIVNNKRIILNEKITEEIISPDEIISIQSNPLVKQELEINSRLRQRIIQVTKNISALVQQNIKVKNWLDRALQSERSIKEQIAVLKGSLLLPRILYQQQILPSSDELEDMTNRIADLRLEQFRVNQQRDVLFQNDSYVLKLKNGHEISKEVHDILLQIIDMRRELLDQLNKQLGNQLMIAIDLQINQQQLVSISKSLQEILTQQIFWVNSNKPIDLEWIKSFPESLQSQIHNMKITVSWGKIWPAIIISFLSSLPLLLIAGLIYWRLDWLKKYQIRLASEVGQLKNDSQLHTPKAIIIDLIYTLPICLLILAIGLILLTMKTSISILFWIFSKKMALFWLIFSLCWKILSKDGVAVHHFNMPEQLTNHWRKQIVRVSVALLPLHFWSVVAELSPLHLMEDVLGQFTILLNLLLITVLIWPMFRNSWYNKEMYRIRLITMTILTIMPIVLVVLTTTGYFYTTLRLAGRWIEVIYLVVIWNLLYQTVLRGLSIAARRIAYRRALARKQNIIIKENAEGVKSQEEHSIALEQVNQQTLRITTLVMLTLFGIMFWAIWSDLIAVFAYLDSIVLWHSNSTEAGTPVVKNVTMGSLLFALVSLVIAWALIHNLPGLLEVLVLSRLNMRQGASYAITTILNYVIIAIGAMVIFSSLGVSWNKLQWLAAALSVGLGFGLQEIFGNFVSGLIILFERPVRIGDTVTIGTFSGIVSKIRIRATTITDFDRKEVIIPNKAFVTERLINWSLSDTITRVVIKLGVAHGSNLDKVRELLLKAAKDHPKVMSDPEPDVFFTTFGSSTLEHELRLYVRELRDRSYTVDELNRTIERLCRENGINIVFNQLEVYLRNEKNNNYIEIENSKLKANTISM